ncbi:hypothetical protein EV385_1674 [Krasilnikovia cinnamomea]|uniref:Uncharacterized protein n=1 Tax=Krasilnikovia cinnamomea TaxID=349313 RepID=A0A4Q7ZGM4_9ACTN|nr:hypothetical protein [Krasilnikovia cinnamomea]RZU49917.1 hypothetical protein EV385_1674 [Krasilnikovia cinnamomea]
MPAIAVPAFALTWWLACYLLGRDLRRPVLWRAAVALLTYASAVAAWTVTPGGTAAKVLLCLPALAWAGAALGLLPDDLPERRQVDRGWLAVSAVFVVVIAALPGAGRLVALAPLVGGLVLVWRSRDTVRPRALAAAVTAAAALYGLGLLVLLLGIDLGSPDLVLAAVGLDLLLLGFLAAVADAVDTGERLLPDLRRSVVGALAATLVVAGPVALTMLAAPARPIVVVLQYLLLAVVMTVFALTGPVRRGLDRVAFLHDERLRADRAALLTLADALPRRRERHSLIALSEQEFIRLTRRALDDYGDLARLLRSPLIDLPAVDRRLTGRVVDQPLARAVELQAVLRGGVARLKPSGLPGTGEQWRHYNALYYLCVLGLRPYERRLRTEGLDRDARQVLEWMRRYVPRRMLREWQTEAAQLVAAELWRELVSTDPRWLTRATANATRSS